MKRFPFYSKKHCVGVMSCGVNRFKMYSTHLEEALVKSPKRSPNPLFTLLLDKSNTVCCKDEVGGSVVDECVHTRNK